VVLLQTNFVILVQIVNLRKNVEKHGALGFKLFHLGYTTSLSGHILKIGVNLVRILSRYILLLDY